jgi:hypothetical protein
LRDGVTIVVAGAAAAKAVKKMAASNFLFM